MTSRRRVTWDHGQLQSPHIHPKMINHTRKTALKEKINLLKGQEIDG